MGVVSVHRIIEELGVVAEAEPSQAKHALGRVLAATVDGAARGCNGKDIVSSGVTRNS